MPTLHAPKQNLKFLVRPGTSDEKVFNEVLLKDSYQKRYFQVAPGETWYDLGANVGAFTCLAAARGARVLAYEPDPLNVQQIQENLALNGLQAEVRAEALVPDDAKEIFFNLWPDGQSWRNSAKRFKKNCRTIRVPAVNFYEVIEPGACIKMDIEGSEIDILMNWEQLKVPVKKLVFEWSFDADPEVAKLRLALGKLKASFKNVKHTSQVERVERWTFFPPCTQVTCWND